jgi:hypothetical protein
MILPGVHQNRRLFRTKTVLELLECLPAGIVRLAAHPTFGNQPSANVHPPELHDLSIRIHNIPADGVQRRERLRIGGRQNGQEANDNKRVYGSVHRVIPSLATSEKS